MEERIEALAERVIALGLPSGFEEHLLHDLAKAVEFLDKHATQQSAKFMGDFLRDVDNLALRHGVIDDATAALLRQVANELLDALPE